MQNPITITNDAFILSEEEMHEEKSKVLLQKLENLKKIITNNNVNMASMHHPNKS